MITPGGHTVAVSIDDRSTDDQSISVVVTLSGAMEYVSCAYTLYRPAAIQVDAWVDHLVDLVAEEYDQVQTLESGASARAGLVESDGLLIPLTQYSQSKVDELVSAQVITEAARTERNQARDTLTTRIQNQS